MNKQEWYKGTLPSWIATSLIALLCFVGIKYLDHVNNRLEEVDRTRNDVNILTVKEAVVESAIIKLEVGQKDVLLELKSINNNIRTK